MACIAASRVMCTGLRASATRSPARRSLVVRASSEETPSTQQGAFFYKGRSYTPEEWAQAVADGTVNRPAVTPDYSVSEGSAAAAGGEPLSLGALMSFSGPAPELINGRLAMLAFVSALGAELASGEPVLRQLADEPTGVVLAAIAFATASLIPLLQSPKREAFAFFTPAAEMLNGRAAMIGFAALLIIEGVRGTALF